MVFLPVRSAAAGAAAAADTPDATMADAAVAPAAAAPETAMEAAFSLMDATMTHLVATTDANELRVTLAQAFADVQAQVESKIAGVANSAGAAAAAAADTTDATMADAAGSPAAAAADGTKTTATHASLVDARKEVEFALVEAALTGANFDHMPVRVKAAISSAPAAAAADTPDATMADAAGAPAAAVVKARADVQATVDAAISGWKMANAAGAAAAVKTEKQTDNDIKAEPIAPVDAKDAPVDAVSAAVAAVQAQVQCCADAAKFVPPADAKHAPAVAAVQAKVQCCAAAAGSIGDIDIADIEVHDELDFHNDPERTIIFRQLAPIYKEETQKMLLCPNQNMTVHEYVEAVKEQWSTYRGDVLHFQFGSEDMFFLVLRSETFNDKTCLILIELTANPAFDDFMLAIDAQQLADLVRSNPPEVNIYQEGSQYDISHFKCGVPRRHAIKDEMMCRCDIQEARQKGLLFPWSTRSRGEGPYAPHMRIKHSSLLTCTQPRNMHNPEFKMVVRDMALEGSYRDKMRATWLLPLKSKRDAFKWKPADIRWQPHTVEEIMDEAQQSNDDFWRKRVLPPMRKVLEKFKQEVADGKHAAEASRLNISKHDDQVSIFELGMYKKFAINNGPFYVLHGKNIEEGCHVVDEEDIPPLPYEFCKSALDGICRGMSKRELKNYEEEQDNEHLKNRKLAAQRLREEQRAKDAKHDKKDDDSARGNIIDVHETEENATINLRVGEPQLVRLWWDRLKEDFKVESQISTLNLSCPELPTDLTFDPVNDNEGIDSQLYELKASVSGSFQIVCFFRFRKLPSLHDDKPDLTLTVYVAGNDAKPAKEDGSAKDAIGDGEGRLIEIKKEREVHFNMRVGVPKRVRLWCGSEKDVAVTWLTNGIGDDPVGINDEPTGIQINRQDGQYDYLYDSQNLTLVASVSGGPKIIKLFYHPGGVAMKKRQLPPRQEDVALHVTVLDAQDKSGGKGDDAKDAKDKGDDKREKHPKTILNESNQIELRRQPFNWFVMRNVMRNVEVQVLLPLHKDFQYLGYHWSTNVSSKHGSSKHGVEIVRQQTIEHSRFKQNYHDVEILTFKITGRGSREWLALYSNATNDKTPVYVLEIFPRASLPEPGTKIDASARLAIPIWHVDPSYSLPPPTYDAIMAAGTTFTIRLNARIVGRPKDGTDWHYKFGPGLHVFPQPWQNNDESQDCLALGKFSMGCVQEVLVSAPAKLKAGKYPIKIFVDDPDNSDNDENPHAIVKITVERADEDKAVVAPKDEDKAVVAPKERKRSDQSNGGAAGGSAGKKLKKEPDVAKPPKMEPAASSPVTRSQATKNNTKSQR